MRVQMAIASATAALGLLAASAASAQSLNATYFSHGNDQDFGTQCCSNSSNLVLSTLGPHGLPVYNTSASNGGFVIHDLTSAGEINWWLPANVTATSVVSLPIENDNMYLPDATGGNDSQGFLTAIFTGTLVLPTAETFTFHLGADDDTFVFIDNQVVDQLGGVHGIADAAATTSVLSAGAHSFKMFYADRAQTGAQLHFSIDTQGVTLKPGVPEPATWALMLLGFGGAGAALRHRKARTATA
jgi:fibro-slime domain-containing protein